MSSTNHSPRASRYWAVFLAALWLPLNAQAALDIPDVPLFLNSTGVKPNFMLTLDDSGSMAWGFAISDPLESAGCTNRADPPSGCYNKKYFKAYKANALYYNPNIQYYPPPRFNGGNCTLDENNPSSCWPNIDFNSAPINGFDTSRGTGTNASGNCNPRGVTGLRASPVNLENDFTATAEYAPNTHSQTCATGEAVTTTSPPSTYTTEYWTTCRVSFRSSDRRISVSNCLGRGGCNPAGCTRPGSSPFTSTNMPASASNLITITLSKSSSSSSQANRSYSVDRLNGSSSLRVTQSLSNETVNNVDISWSVSRTQTGGTVTDYPAYYYMYYSDLGVSRPSNCSTTNPLADDDCYIKVNVGSMGGGAAGSGWDRIDIYKNPDGTAANEDQKRQNFANWYSYYRTRNLSLVSNVMTAMTGLDDSVRVAWQALNTCDSWPLSSSACKGWDNPSNGYDQRMQALGGSITNGRDPFTGANNATHRQELYAWLSRLPANNGTPLREATLNAGRYFDAASTPLSASSPWAENPPSTAGTYHSCRRNIHLLMTDGIWNTGLETVTINVGNANSNEVTLPAPSKLPAAVSGGNPSDKWTPAAPYSDNSSNNIADIAFYYWAKDLQPSLDNNLTSYYIDRTGSARTQWLNPKNDPAEWQHLTTYAIGLGLRSALTQTGYPQWGGSTYAGDYAKLAAGTMSWPNTGNDSSPENAYDLWHAAISGRGKFYSADDSYSLKVAFQDVVDTVSSIASAGGGAGLGSNSTKITTDTTVYLATFSGDWSGSLQAIALTKDGGLGTTYWDASQLIPYADQRKIFTTNSGAKQELNSCTGNLSTALNINRSGIDDGLCTQRLAWLRGKLRITNASWSTTDGGTAIYTSPGHGLNVGDSIEISGVTPEEYNGVFDVTATSTNVFSVDLANNPGPFSTATTGTVRYRGFRPRTATVLGDIMNSDPIFSHKEDFGYGSSNVTLSGHSSYASYVASKSSRTPMLYVGANDGMLHAFNAETVGANAGKEYFSYVPAAVYGNLSQLTSPQYEHKFFVDGSPTVHDIYTGSSWKTYLVSGLGAGGKSVFALDITNASNPASLSASDVVKWEYSNTDLGLTFSQPQVAPTRSNEWSAIFGNGYNSNSGMAYLFVVDMNTGNLIDKVGTNSATDNGLATPYLYDSDGDKIVDVAYAGDMKGNMWKFVNSNGTWTLGNGGDPLFTASLSGNIQPITSQPSVLPHPNGGVMVYFGTGSYLTNSDLTNDKPQSFYGIWDNGTAGTVARSNLLGQTITTSGNLRTSSSNTMDWTSSRGWYINFPATSGKPSERMLSAPLAKDFSTIEDRVIFVTTTPTDDPCQRGGISWLMEVNTLSGGNPSGPVLDTNDDGIIDASDATVSGKQLPDTLGISKTPLWIDGGEDNSGYAFKFFTGSKGTTHTEKQTGDPEPPAGGAGTPVRIYWRQIL